MFHVLYIIINISRPRKRIKNGECHATSYGSLRLWCKKEVRKFPPNAFARAVLKCVQWHKATTKTIEKYSEALSSRMEQSGLYIPPLSVNKLADSITECLHGAATAALHVPLKPFNKYAKPYWTREVKSAHEVSRSRRKDWLAEGKPRGSQHQSYTNYKNAKASFRRIQRHESEKYFDKVFSDLDEAAGLDYRLFWRLLKKIQNKPNQGCIRL